MGWISYVLEVKKWGRWRLFQGAPVATGIKEEGLLGFGAFQYQRIVLVVHQLAARGAQFGLGIKGANHDAMPNLAFADFHFFDACIEVDENQLGAQFVGIFPFGERAYLQYVFLFALFLRRFFLGHGFAGGHYGLALLQQLVEVKARFGRFVLLHFGFGRLFGFRGIGGVFNKVEAGRKGAKNDTCHKKQPARCLASAS